MIDFDFNKNCYGCRNCENICPNNAIKISENKEGFLVPIINKDKCINCGACDNVCPYIGKIEQHDIKQNKWYGCFMKDEEERENSSSGGIFPLLSNYVLSQKGMICGCVWNDQMHAEHILSNSEEQIKKMKGSKYVQSDLQEIVKNIKENIKTHKILFTGTPCQIAAIKLYIGKNENLYTCSLICEGVASPKVWKKYKESLEKKYKSKLKKANFRYKKELGWSSPVVKYQFESGKSIKRLSFNYDYYVRSFLEGLTYRNSCSNCQYKGNRHNADIIIGDLWGATTQEINKSKNKGISLIIVNSRKGKELFEAIKSELIFFEADKKKEIDHNKLLMNPKVKHENREKFYANIEKKDIVKNIRMNLKGNNLKSNLKEIAYKTKLFKTLKRAKIK